MPLCFNPYNAKRSEISPFLIRGDISLRLMFGNQLLFLNPGQV